VEAGIADDNLMQNPAMFPHEHGAGFERLLLRHGRDVPGRWSSTLALARNAIEKPDRLAIKITEDIGLHLIGNHPHE